MHFTIYAIPSLISAAVMIFIVLYVLFRRRNSTGAVYFIILISIFSIWALGYAMVLLCEGLPHKIIFFNISQIGPDYAPVIWLFLVLTYTGQKNALNNKWIYSVLILPILTTILMWTNDLHHLLRTNISLRSIGIDVSYLSIERGPWFYIETAYGYIVLLIPLIMLFYFVGKASSKRQIITLIVGMMLPLISNLLDILQINPLKPYGPTSIVFSMTGLVLTWGLFHEHFLDIAPIARNIVLEKIGDGVVVLDTNNRIIDYNPAAIRLFYKYHGSPSGIIGHNVYDTISLWDESNQQSPSINDEDRYPISLRIGEERQFFNIAVTPLTNNKQEAVGKVTIFHDVTDIQQANERLQEQITEINALQEQLREQAIHDPLTGCFNRHYLNELLLRESSRSNRDKKSIGLIMLDIDQFKEVNDTYGHIAGDQVLSMIGNNLQTWVRTEDIVCRFGGEEFLIVLSGVTLSSIKERANSICRKISNLSIPLPTNKSIQVTVSIGAAIHPYHGKDINKVLDYADQSLYAAKKAGKSCVRIWDEMV